MLDTTDPQRPRARSLAAALARIVRARAINPRSSRDRCGTALVARRSLPKTVDRLVDFARTTDAVPSALLDLVHDAYLANPEVRDFLMCENPEAGRAMVERFEQARQLGLWHPRRNDIDGTIAEFARRGRVMNAPISAPMRRGACPGLSARWRPATDFSPGSRRRTLLRFRPLRGLCAAARRYGNGIIEITSRGQHPVPRIERSFGRSFRR